MQINLRFGHSKTAGSETNYTENATGKRQSFVDDVGNRIVSAVTVPDAWADCSMVAETIEDWARHCVSWSRVREVGVQSKRGELGPPTNQVPAWCNSREIRSPLLARSTKESNVCVCASHKLDR